MKKSNDIIIWWAAGEDEDRDWYVVVHSKKMTKAALDRAWKRYQKEDFVRAVVPQIFLDDSLDSPALRTFLRAESERRSRL